MNFKATIKILILFLILILLNQAKFSFGSINLTDKFGFNVSARYLNDFRWERQLMISENLTFDASLNFDVPDLKGKLKLVL